MPSKTSKKKPAATLPHIPNEVIDQFVSGPMTAEAVNAASMASKKALIERALGAELSHQPNDPDAAVAYKECALNQCSIPSRSKKQIEI
jgi:hypothetical protein